MVVPDSIYDEEVDFVTLSLQFPDFARKLRAKGQLNFNDPESVRHLTKALLKRDFDIELDLPDDRLCPPVPNRFSYVVFAHKLLSCTRLDYAVDSDDDDTDLGQRDRILCLDIGTGASAIYPLLGCRQHPKWYFIATEIDDKSRRYAESNIRANGLDSRIRLVHNAAESSKQLLPAHVLENLDDYAIGLQMTNPPFYGSEAEMLQSAREKARPPNSACSGAPVEVITAGGEVQFISRLVDESVLALSRRKIQWFSSMLGKLSSVALVLEKLKSVHCDNFAVAEFNPGHKTRRWCVAWSWLGLRPTAAVARGTTSISKNLLPFPAESRFDLPPNRVKGVGSAVAAALAEVGIQWRPRKNGHPGGVGRSIQGDVWSRKARRKQHHHHHHQNNRDMDQEMQSPDHGAGVGTEPELVFAIDVEDVVKREQMQKQQQTVHVRWLQGHDAVLFESFCGWLKRKLTM